MRIHSFFFRFHLFSHHLQKLKRWHPNSPSGTTRATLGGLMTNIRSLSINSSWDLLTLIMLLKFCWHLADQMPFFVHLVNRLLYYLSVLYRWKSLQWECIRTSLSNNLLWFENQQQKIERSEQHLKMYVFYYLFQNGKTNYRNARCLKITEKVSFNIASEANYIYILSGQKLIKNAKKWLILASR